MAAVKQVSIPLSSSRKAVTVQEKAIVHSKCWDIVRRKLWGCGYLVHYTHCVYIQKTKQPCIYSVSHPLTLTVGTEELTLSIQNDTATSDNIQTVQLSFVLGRDMVVETRSIRLAAGSLYNFRCALATLDFEDAGVWTKDGNVVFSDESDPVYARLENSKAWNLVMTSFSAGEAGVYTCNCDGISLSINVSVGK